MADYAVFEKMEDLDAFLASSEEAKISGTYDLAERFYSFYSFCDFTGGNSHKFTIERNKFYGKSKT